MSVMRIIVLHRIPSLKFVGLLVPKIWLIFGHGVKRPGDLDLDLSTSKCGHRSPMSWVFFLPSFSLLHLSIFDLGSGTGQTDKQTTAINA